MIRRERYKDADNDTKKEIHGQRATEIKRRLATMSNIKIWQQYFPKLHATKVKVDGVIVFLFDQESCGAKWLIEVSKTDVSNQC